MIRRPPRSTRTDTLFPYTTLFRSAIDGIGSEALVSRIRASGHRDARYMAEPADLAPIIQGIAKPGDFVNDRSEEHTSELQSLMRISYAVFCLKKKNNNKHISYTLTNNDRQQSHNTTPHNNNN